MKWNAIPLHKPLVKFLIIEKIGKTHKNLKRKLLQHFKFVGPGDKLS